MQVLFAAMLVGSAHAAFEQGEVAFDRIGRDRAARVFFRGVIDAFMFGEFIAEAFVASIRPLSASSRA